MAIKRAISWPPPVYVATFAGGEVCRMSVGQYEKKAGPYAFDRARKICNDVVATERGWKARAAEFEAAKNPGFGVWHPDDVRRWTAAHGYDKPADDMLAGHFEDGDQIIPDPFFTGEAAPVTKAKTTAFDRALAAIGKLSFDDMIRLSVEIDARLDIGEKMAAD